ncbi:MAG: PfkB family carbohydrate kinase [Anaerolineae bacterium]
MTPLSYLVIGHITQDMAKDGYVLGGTATYAAVTATRLGLKARVFTAVAPSVVPALQELAAPGDVAVVESPETTVFKNEYTASGRQQHLLSRATALSPEHLPTGWNHPDIAHLGPVAREVSEGFMTAFPPSTTLGLTPQGWLRTWDEEGKVAPDRWEPAPELLARASALVLSQEDVGTQTDLIDYYAAHCPVTVVTRGYAGCTLYIGGEVHHLGTRGAREVDPTGAGDVFATAFFIRLHETGDPFVAAGFANVAGSMSVEGPGTSAIPSREQVEAWLESQRLPHASR